MKEPLLEGKDVYSRRAAAVSVKGHWVHEQLRSSWAMSDFLISQADEFSRHISQAAEEHDEVVEAVRLRNGPAARRAMEAHILEFRMKVLDALASRERGSEIEDRMKQGGRSR